jgi:hypothetical protein
MIPRYQRILFWSFIAAILLMAAFLLHGCRQAHKRLTAPVDTSPIAAPVATSTQDVTLYIANDADASITPTQQKLALPDDPTVRARALLDHLLSGYSHPGSTHVLPGGPAIDDVFLVPNTPSTQTKSTDTTQMAIVNLSSAFADHHPSGIQVETLTLLSIIGTLHAAFPPVTQVKFLVDGQPRETLAGHADLLHTYAATDTTYKPTPPTEGSSQP